MSKKIDIWYCPRCRNDIHTPGLRACSKCASTLSWFYVGCLWSKKWEIHSAEKRDEHGNEWITYAHGETYWVKDGIGKRVSRCGETTEQIKQTCQIGHGDKKLHCEGGLCETIKLSIGEESVYVTADQLDGMLRLMGKRNPVNPPRRR